MAASAWLFTAAVVIGMVIIAHVVYGNVSQKVSG